MVPEQDLQLHYKIEQLRPLGLKIAFLRVLLGGCKNMSRLGFSMVRGPVDEDSQEPVEGAFIKEELSSFLSVYLS